MSLRYKNLWLVFGWCLIAITIYLELTPNPPNPVQFPHVDKVEHATVYMLLMLWFAQIYQSRGRRLAWAVGLVVMGIVLEILQGLSGYRDFEYLDMVANAVGVTVALGLSATPLGRILLGLERWLSVGSPKNP